MKLFNRNLFNPATFNAGQQMVKLFNKAQFRNPTFNTGEIIALRLFNKALSAVAVPTGLNLCNSLQFQSATG